MTANSEAGRVGRRRVEGDEGTGYWRVTDTEVRLEI